jgi:hypothetical protein
MEDDLTFFENGRRPHFLCKWKTTSFPLLMEDNLKCFVNLRQPLFLWKLKEYFNLCSKLKAK